MLVEEDHRRLWKERDWYFLAGSVLLGYAAGLAIPDPAFDLVILFGFGVAVPVACGVAVLKHGLYDLDVVISKTVVYALLAAFFTIAYLAIVVGIGTAIGSSNNSFLTVLAAARIVEAAITELKRLGAVIVDPADIETAGGFEKTEFDVLLYEFKADLNAYLERRGSTRRLGRSRRRPARPRIPAAHAACPARCRRRRGTSW